MPKTFKLKVAMKNYHLKDITISKMVDSTDFEITQRLLQKLYSRSGKSTSFKASLVNENNVHNTFYSLKDKNKIVGCFALSLTTEFVKNAIDSNGLSDEVIDKTMLMTHFAVDYDYRGLDILKKIFTQVHIHLVKTNKENVLISADDRMAKKYKYLAFEYTGSEYKKKPVNNLPPVLVRSMITKQTKWGIYGLHADPIRWNIFLKEATDRLIEEKVIKHSFFVKVLFGLYRLFGPLAKFLENTQKNKYKKSKAIDYA